MQPRLIPTITFIPEANTLRFFQHGIPVGEVDFEFDGGTFSEYLDNGEIEFYMAHIGVDEQFQRQGIGTQMLIQVMAFARQLGATVVTLRIDHGCGYSGRLLSDGHLERLYQNAGFVFAHPEDLDDGAMECRLNPNPTQTPQTESLCQ